MARNPKQPPVSRAGESQPNPARRAKIDGKKLVEYYKGCKDAKAL